MPKRFFLQKVATYSTESIASGYFASDKLDGISAFWDGGITRDMPKELVPWSNTIRDARYVNEQVATGLWSQYGHPIYAPKWFLDALPPVVMTGELFAGNGNFQHVQSTAKKQVPVDDEWRHMQFMPLDMPNVVRLFADGKVTMLLDEVWFRHTLTFFAKHAGDIKYVSDDVRYEIRRARLAKYVGHDNSGETLMFHKEAMLERFREVVESGGEGLVLKSRNNIWTPHREKDIFKVKPFLEDEATVVGFIAGDEGKFDGMIGAYICDYKGKRLELSGMNNAMRELLPEWIPHCRPKQELPVAARGMNIRVGNTVTFRYRELSNDGIPKEARFIRKREAL